MTRQANNRSTAHTSFSATLQAGLYKNMYTTKLSAAAWQIAYTALWNTATFSESEKEAAINFIMGFINQYKNLKKGYTDFVQRVLLARQYVRTHSGTYIPIPTAWFSIANKNGFSGTAAWLAAVDNTRASLPHFKGHLTAFAEAVLETTENKSPGAYHYWRNYFIEQEKQQLLNLYLAVLGGWCFE